MIAGEGWKFPISEFVVCAVLKIVHQKNSNRKVIVASDTGQMLGQGRCGHMYRRFGHGYSSSPYALPSAVLLSMKARRNSRNVCFSY